MGYEKVPDGYSFSTEFETYIIAFCPDTDEWFVTNKRFFYYEFPMEFRTEEDGISYFRKHASTFYQLEIDMEAYRPSVYEGVVFLSNTNELIRVDADVRRYFGISDMAYELLQERVRTKYYDASVALHFDYMNMTMKAIAYCERDRKSVKPVCVSIEYDKILGGYTYEDLSEDIIKELDKRYDSKKPKKIPAPTTRPRVYYCQSCGAPVKVGATRCDYCLSEFVYAE